MKKIILTLAFNCLVFFLEAQVPKTFAFQGLLLDANGQAVAPGNYDFDFSIWDDPIAGDTVWTETQNNIEVDGEGVYHVLLGSVKPMDIAFDNPYWLEIEVNGETLSPRTSLSGAAYSLNSHLLDLSDGELTGSKVGAGINGDNINNGTITASKIASNSLTASQIGTDAVGNDELVDDIGLNSLYSYLVQVGGSTNNQSLRVLDASGNLRVYLDLDDAAGAVKIYSPLGSQNVVLRGQGTGREYGEVAVYDNNDNKVASLRSDGNGVGYLYVSGTKNFVMEHPSRPNYQIFYSAIEGPEAAAYIRGQVELVNGEAQIQYAEHFIEVANMDGLTINLTPHSAESKGLAAIERTADGFRIKELFSGTGNYLVDWEAKAERKGFEDFEVVRKKEDSE